MLQKLFISFTSPDRQKAEWIAWTLRNAGHMIAIHTWDVPPGGNFLFWMNEKLVWADRVIAVVSPDYGTAEYSLVEWLSAFHNDPTGVEGRLVPVIVRPTPDLPPLMRAISHIDITDVDETEAAKRLIDGIGGSAGERALERARRNPFIPNFSEPIPITQPSFDQNNPLKSKLPNTPETNFDIHAFVDNDAWNISIYRGGLKYQVFESGVVPSDVDVAYNVELVLQKMPKEPAESELLFAASRLFRRAAFYSHPEKDFAAGLWAVMKTRFVWEQEVMPRLHVSRRAMGHGVTQALLRLADLHIEILGIDPVHLEQITRAGFAAKSRFIERVRRQADSWEKACKRIEAAHNRIEALFELRTALNGVGIDASCVGEREFSPSE